MGWWAVNLGIPVSRPGTNQLAELSREYMLMAVYAFAREVAPCSNENLSFYTKCQDSDTGFVKQCWNTARMFPHTILWLLPCSYSRLCDPQSTIQLTLNNMGVRSPDPRCSWKSVYNRWLPTNLPTNSRLSPRPHQQHKQSISTHFVCYVFYIYAAFFQ